MKTPAKLIFWRFSGVFLLFNFCGRFKKFGRRFFPLIVILRSDGFVFVFRLDFAVCGSFLCVKLFHLPPNVFLAYEISANSGKTHFLFVKLFRSPPSVFSAYEISADADKTHFLAVKLFRSPPNAFSVCEKIRMCFPMRFLFIKIFANAAQRVFRQ